MFAVTARNANSPVVSEHLTTVFTSQSPTPPGPPLNPRAVAVIGNLTLSWSAPDSNGGSPITAYSIYRSASPITDLLRPVKIGNSTSYEDTLVSNGQIYYYKISAWNFIGEGPVSEQVNATVPVPPSQTPAEPSGVPDWEIAAGIAIVLVLALAVVRRRRGRTL